jgi:hypothetical protein
MEQWLAGAIRLPEFEAGLGIPGFLEPSIPTDKLIANADAYRLDLWSLRRFALRRKGLNGLLLGFAPFTEQELRTGVIALARAADSIA